MNHFWFLTILSKIAFSGPSPLVMGTGENFFFGKTVTLFMLFIFSWSNKHVLVYIVQAYNMNLFRAGKILRCQVNTSRWGLKHLGISFGIISSIFL